MDKQQKQPIPPPLEEMNRIGIWVLDTLKNQGLSFLLLGLAVWHIQGQNDLLSREIRSCQEEKYNALLSVIESNTKALNSITDGKEEAQPKKKR